jgi:AraC-like DNA-binding protein
MKLVECNPKDDWVRQFVDRYQYYRIFQPSYLQTIPNARLELWHIYDGGFLIWNTKNQEWHSAPQNGGYPATQSPQLFFIDKKLDCINIKFKISAFSFSIFQELLPADVFRELSILNAEFIPGKDLIFQNGKLNTPILDQWVLEILKDKQSNSQFLGVINCLENNPDTTVSNLANACHLSERGLHRLIRKFTTMSPKELINVYRFINNLDQIKRKNTAPFSSILATNYYDQSHFIRECKKLTGMPPAQLISKLNLVTPDLMISEGKENRL